MQLNICLTISVTSLSIVLRRLCCEEGLKMDPDNAGMVSFLMIGPGLVEECYEGARMVNLLSGTHTSTRSSATSIEATALGGRPCILPLTQSMIKRKIRPRCGPDECLRAQ
jgi:hypothetical protein